MESVDVGGLRLAYRRAGRGEPLLLLHGAFGDGRDWCPQLAGLSDRYDVVAVDAPGCGGSADPPGPLSLRAYADLVAGFCAALDLGRPHVCGLSFGAVCALAVHRHHPQLARSFVLASAYAGWAGSLPPAEVARRKEWAARALERPAEEWGPQFLATVFGAGAPPSVLADAMEILRDVRPAFRLVAEPMADADLRDVLPTITVPTLLLHGELDERSPLAVAAEMHARIPGSQLVVLPGVGHGSANEAPELFNAAVREFLTQVARPAGE